MGYIQSHEANINNDIELFRLKYFDLIDAIKICSQAEIIDYSFTNGIATYQINLYYQAKDHHYNTTVSDYYNIFFDIKDNIIINVNIFAYSCFAYVWGLDMNEYILKTFPEFNDMLYNIFVKHNKSQNTWITIEPINNKKNDSLWEIINILKKN